VIYAFGDCELDIDRYELRHGDGRCHVEPQVFDILAYLVAHRDRVVTRDELLAQVWGHSFVSEATVSSRVMAARKAIGDSGRAQELIRTVRGRGYQFVAPVEELAGAPGSLPKPLDAPVRAGRLIGRATELAALSELLDAALAGQRGFALVTGEAGAGKTTLVEGFLDEASSDSALLVAYGRCVEQRAAIEPYMSILEALGRMCRRPEGEEVVAILSRLAPTWVSQMPGLVDEHELEAVRARSLGARTERMLREMAAALDALGSVAPVVLAVDDLHWADESTLGLLAHVARTRDPARLLIVGATRPTAGGPVDELRRELRPRGECLEVALALLEAGEVRSYLEERYPGAESLAPVVHRRTNGNPLFMDCLLRSWVDTGALSRRNGSWEVGREERELALDIPDTLRELLEQDLERLSSEDRRTLEVASAVGQYFSAAAVAPSLGLEVQDVETRCADLARRRRFLRDRGSETWPDGTVAAAFGFVHHLHGQVLYERIPAGRRARIHDQIAKRLEAGYGPEAPQRAAELAGHFLEAGDDASAVRYLQLAAEQASSRGAHHDAVHDLTAALDLAGSSRGLPDQRRLRLSLQTELARALVWTEGFTSDSVDRAYREALDLARQLEEHRPIAILLYELAAVHEIRGDYPGTEALIDEALRVEGADRDQARLLEAHELMACSLFHQGSFRAALDHADRGLELFRSDQQYAGLAYHGEDPAVSCNDWAGLSLWCLGHPDQALERIGAALELAGEAGREYGLANARMHAARVHQLRREPAEALVHAEATVALARERGFAYQAASGLVLGGWALAVKGNEDGIGRLREGLNGHRAIGVAVDRPYYLALLADASLSSGGVDEGLDAIADALELLAGDRTFFYEPELHRLRGALILERVSSNEGELVEPSFRRALELARRQGAKSLELRAAVSLARLLRERGAPSEALELLRGTCGRFGERAGGADLNEARTLAVDLERAQSIRAADA
jgi:DNA-binding winged helix-turn-helix (wHTH) protein/tetratricopeptide (TPR) repeat protein